MKAADLLAAGADAHVLLTALSDGRVDTPHTAAQLVRAGLPHLLSGMPESEWLEVKKMPYNLKAPRPSGTAQKFELAKDVARFANGDNDAVLAPILHVLGGWGVLAGWGWVSRLVFGGLAGSGGVGVG